MSDKHTRQGTSSRKHKEEASKSLKRKNSYQDYKKYEIEARTPPLPKHRHSIEDLMRQRESLKEELQLLKETKSTDIQSSREISKRKHRDDERNSKFSKLNHLDSSKKTIKSKTKGHVSPEYNTDKYLDSEDEENIIELRRKQRKQLLEKLNVTTASTKNENNITKNEKSENKTLEKKIDSVIPSNKNLPQKENTNSAQLSDMFSEKDDFVPQNVPGARDTDENNSQLTDNWDDSEGYYNIRVGDIIKNKYVLKEILGQGVFANVIHAQDNTKNNASVAIKIVRNNELMYKTSLKEISILNEINVADPDNKYHCVKYICNFMHKGHLCIVLEAMHMDLRSVLKKYGKNNGIHMRALTSYSRQLLVALRLLKKIGIIHADIKPDNILVNEKKNVLKLCDFGSAAKLDENEATPYLVSRFYRAPEIILGIPYSHGIDIWSTACTIFEMATGRILFTGSSNNRMLKCFMDLKGKIPVKCIRKGKFKDQHFNYKNNFLLHKKDEFTGRDKVIEVCNNNITRDLYKELQKYSKKQSPAEQKKLTQLKDQLEKMLILDPNHRLSVSDCLRHAFIQEQLEIDDKCTIDTW
ncbi:Serine/threonine-protein kinase PRP4-like protein [Operophtera brumata]|uniref:non-specific serine/threonine protein kinase n=1 Tax=Operophtera brumata TaxID=104452 RepID=A0A0L7KJK0_OPEBR|nr:Serine/threonine-protein kinase PRP4-like protein [Operophtera brumata]